MFKNKPSAIIFDLDGTLVDSAIDLTASLNYVLELAGRDKIELSAVRQMVGQGARALIIKGFSHSGSLPAEHQIDEILQQYLDHYLLNISAGTIVFDGAMEILEKLKHHNIPIGICTNKLSKMSHALLNELNIDHYFSSICCGDTFDYKKPDPRHLLSTCQMMGVDPKYAIMVGDSASDINGALAANIPVIAVSFGYTDIPVKELGADIIIDHYGEFVDAVNKIIPRP